MTMKIQQSKQNLWDTAKAVLRWKFIAIRVTTGNKKNLKQPNLKATREGRTDKAQVSRRKEIVKIQLLRKSGKF